MKKNTIISVESEENPGIIKRYLVADIDRNGYVKLIYQSEYQNAPYTKDQLVAYMRDNGISQKMLASILGISRCSVSRYFNGDREVPQWVFELLSIKTQKTELQLESHIEKLTKLLISVRDILDKAIKEIREDTL